MVMYGLLLYSTHEDCGMALSCQRRLFFGPEIARFTRPLADDLLQGNFRAVVERRTSWQKEWRARTSRPFDKRSHCLGPFGFWTGQAGALSCFEGSTGLHETKRGNGGGKPKSNTQVLRLGFSIRVAERDVVLAMLLTRLGWFSREALSV
jgi:hypothetical protein